MSTSQYGPRLSSQNSTVGADGNSIYPPTQLTAVEMILIIHFMSHYCVTDNNDKLEFDGYQVGR